MGRNLPTKMRYRYGVRPMQKNKTAAIDPRMNDLAGLLLFMELFLSRSSNTELLVKFNDKTFLFVVRRNY